MSDANGVNERRPRLFWWVAALAVYWLVMFIATHIPVPIEIAEVAPSDKVLHFVAYAILGVLLGLVISQRRRPRWTHFLIGLVVILLYGVADGQLQKFVNRFCDIEDWIADSAGAATGMLVTAASVFLRRGKAEAEAKQPAE